MLLIIILEIIHLQNSTRVCFDLQILELYAILLGICITFPDYELFPYDVHIDDNKQILRPLKILYF